MEVNQNIKLQGTFSIKGHKVLDAKRLEKLQGYLLSKEGKLDAFTLLNSGFVETLPCLIRTSKNLVVNTGGALGLDLLAGLGGTAFNNANAFIGVGNGNTAPAVGQTDLQGASKVRKAMDATFPSRAAQILSYQSTYGTVDANFSWEELAIFNAAVVGTMFCRSLNAAPFIKTTALIVVVGYTLTCP